MDNIPAQRCIINSCKMPEIKYQKVNPCVGSFCFQEKKFLERERERESTQVGKLGTTAGAVAENIAA